MSEAPTTPPPTEAAVPAAPPSPASAGAALFPDGGANSDPPDPPTDSPSQEPVSGPAPIEEVPAPEAKIESPSGEETTSAPEYSFTLPEGFTADDTLTTRAKEVFAKAGVSPEGAQPLIDLFAETLSAQRTAGETAYATQQSEWIAAIDAMPEFQGPTKEKSLASIGRLLDTFGSEDAKAALNIGGVGNNPALVKFILSVAKELDEGSSTSQGRPAATGRDGRSIARRSMGEILFPDQPTS